MLRYLCLSGSQSGRLEKLILDANPLLEAFGNAKTIRNNNSSRFGKFIEIHYSSKFTVTGGLFFHYLLEKSRICTQSAGERNYHIFYQLCACLPTELWQELRLGPPDKFRYLNGGCTQYFCSKENDLKLGADRKSRQHRSDGAIQDQLIDDLECYQQTERALTNFGLNEEQKRVIYRIVAAVLHLGNISFEDDPDDNRGGCRLATGDAGLAEQSLEITSQLMGLEADLLRQSLVSRIMSTARGGHKGTVYMVQLSAQQAQAARDALAKAIYSRLFDHIVTKIVNKSIPFSSSSYYIGVLDVAGFEYFQHNSFEQFLINFCNEKLQQFFNERILKEEQTIYEKEGLHVKRVEFTDNQDCIQLFEAKSAGIFDLLDEESRLPKPNCQHFTQAVHAANKGHFRLAVPRASKLKSHREIRDDEGFLVRHFAGAVCYETHSFIDKNNDALHASLRNLMLEANNEMLRNLFVEQNQAQHPSSTTTTIYTQSHSSSSASTNKLNFISVGTTFRSQLNDLMAKLRSTGSHFIRCVKPNSEMIAHKFEGGQILSQLHCSGMDSVLELMQQGFPSRLSFNDLYASYRNFLPAELARLDSHLFCRALFKAIGLHDGDFRFGCSKVFFRPGKFSEFDQIIRTDGEHVAELVRKVSKWLIRSRWRKAQYCCLSVVKLENKIVYRRNLIVRLQRNWRMAAVTSRLRFRLQAIRAARLIRANLDQFETIAAKQLRKFAGESNLIEEQTRLLKQELDSFVGELAQSIQRAILSRNNNGDNNNNQKLLSLQQQQQDSNSRQSLREAKEKCQQDIERLSTKRDLLIRSIRDKIANKEKEFLELEQRMALENKRREEEELAKRREEEIKQQRNELEARRQLELKQQQQINSKTTTTTIKGQQRRLVESGTDPVVLAGQDADQERRDYEIACRLAGESAGGVGGVGGVSVSANSTLLRQASGLLAPSENHANSPTPNEKYDLTKWKYSDLRDTINTSCDLELLEACKREFHRRLKVYHAWRAMNSSRQNASVAAAAATTDGALRAPTSVMQQSDGRSISSIGSDELRSSNSGPLRTANEQRFFRIPFVRPTSSTNGPNGGPAATQRGWWFAHFDGQWIARQLELHPDREPILLIAGQHDIEMCELSLRETRLTSKRGAEILPQEFEEEWSKHGGKPYKRGYTGTIIARK